ncbi:DUF4240 domain-containing protein [Actinomadura roseirufa]|uniref:DUF4240 domain-containing protein n=1 Tax=Actinomadura roseirufa TaxID=2094049 RepID=UPI0010417D69|nr:DUF4240 domain-containing protein [Actinomadura roseirufa]
MDITDFWNIIEAARTNAASSTDDPDQAVATALADALAATSKQAVLEYQRCFEKLDTAIFRWDVWAAGYLIGGGCSDDSFMDFRAGLIAQGRDWYERVVASPDALAEHPDIITAAAEGRDRALFTEMVNYAPSDAYGRIHGDDDGCIFYDDYDEFLGPQAEREPAHMGEDFDFEDAAEMHARLPRLARLFLGRAPI